MSGPGLRPAPTYRSLLFVPGGNLEWMLKAPKYGADALILDLEDSVAVDDKARARSLVSRAVAEMPPGPALFIRVNAMGAGAHRDVLETFAGRVAGYVLPKTDGVHHIHALDLLLAEMEAESGLAIGRTEIVPLPETARGFHSLFEICASSARIRRAPGGPSAVPGGDAAHALGVEVGDEGHEMLYFAASATTAIRAAGVTEVLGGMTTRIDDLDLARRVAIRARTMGSTGGMAIHPSHVPILNQVFAPSSGDIEAARAIVVAMAAAAGDGSGAIRHNGAMIDYAHIRSSLDVLERARRLGLDVGDVPDVELPEPGVRP